MLLCGSAHVPRPPRRRGENQARCAARPPFEEACRQFLWRAYTGGALPAGLEFDVVGTWWDGDHEIDVVAMEGAMTTLVGSCKWTNARVGLRELRALQSALAAGGRVLNRHQAQARCGYYVRHPAEFGQHAQRED